jgi:toxin ParE1/3/4
MSQCILSPKALRDLNDISSYCAQQNIEAGERVLGIRGITLEGYIIFYRIIETDIIILRVISGRQNLANLFVDGDEDN